MAKGRILAIDDEKFFRHFYQDLLASEGYEVLAAASGEEGLEAVRREDFDLVITDMQMPGMDGVETTERIRRLRPGQDVMVVTGQKEVEKAVAAMKSGVAEYLLKPINPDEFLHVVSQLLFRQCLTHEHSRLVSENVEFNAMLAAQRRCLSFFRIYDLDQLCDLVLDTLMELLSAEGAVLRFGGDDAIDRPRHCQRGLVRIDAEMPDAQSTLIREPGLLDEGRLLLLPLRGEQAQLPVAAIRVESPLGRESFSREDLGIGMAVAEFAGCALHAVMRYRRVEDKGLRAARRQAYNMAFFRDYLEREIQKVRRFDRPLSLLRLRIANDAELRAAFRERHVETMLEELLDKVQSVLREEAVLAMVAPHDYYVLLPETDHWDALMVQKQLRQTLDGIGVAELKRSLPAEIHMRSASIPGDGEDFESLDRVLLERLERLPRSLAQRLAVQSLPFWKAVKKLVGRPGDYRLEDGGLEVEPRLEKAEEGVRSRYFCMPMRRLDEITRTFVREAADVRSGRGIILRSCTDFGRTAHELPLDELENSSTTLYLLGGDGDVRWDYRRTVPVFIDDERFRKLSLLLYLGEDQAYVIFAWRKGQQIVGFHTADFFFVETMIGKLLEHYRLHDPAQVA